MLKDKGILLEDLTNHFTIVSEWKSKENDNRSFQTEAQLENSFINDLTKLGYEYLSTLKNDEQLILNLRIQIERLNNYHFSESDWKRFYDEYINNKNQGIKDKTWTIQEDHIKSFKDENNNTHNIKLIDKEIIANNKLQVINQFENPNGNYVNRYDVTILVNGLPLVHIELKKRGVELKEAFNQIFRYQNNSFSTGSRLFQYVQIFVISDGTYTRYYSNTTRQGALQVNNETTITKNDMKSCSSFEFTSIWSDQRNNHISDLRDFTQTFFESRTLLKILTRYCVFTFDKKLLVMRPYQIAATEKILEKIIISINNKNIASKDTGGYIWHTTGSGKTLTSFKTATLASKLPNIGKIIFVVDRSDLDYQTIQEFNKFQEGSVDVSISTSVLQRQIENKDKDGNYKEYKIIVTTIQKLSRFIKNNTNHAIFNEHVVFIFDECHRSQFGSMHKNITKNFKKYNMFGFTGTPIRKENAINKEFTTATIFGPELHAYTIKHAIRDGNVLQFKISYNKTFSTSNEIRDDKIKGIDEKAVYENPKRIKLIVGVVQILCKTSY